MRGQAPRAAPCPALSPGREPRTAHALNPRTGKCLPPHSCFACSYCIQHSISCTESTARHLLSRHCLIQLLRLKLKTLSVRRAAAEAGPKPAEPMLRQTVLQPLQQPAGAGDGAELAPANADAPVTDLKENWDPEAAGAPAPCPCRAGSAVVTFCRSTALRCCLHCNLLCGLCRTCGHEIVGVLPRRSAPGVSHARRPPRA